MSFDPVDDRAVCVQHESKRQCFQLDYVFGPDKSQQDVFAEVRPLLTSCVDGYNVCIFAYGQTGSGKTYTMDGPCSDPGINPRALTVLFEEAESRRPDWQFTITVSMLEIYNESIRDLFSNKSKLDVKMNLDGTLGVPGLLQMEVTCVDEINTILRLGRQNRVTASTKLNDVSSRSHAILIVNVRGENKNAQTTVNAKLNLVDLAGSERVDKSGAVGERLKETQSINKSLSALGDVICALRTRRQHVPFRNSKLTYLLQDCLSGDSKTAMMVQLSPTASSISETLCSLNFASRVRGVELGQAQAHKSTAFNQNVLTLVNHHSTNNGTCNGTNGSDSSSDTISTPRKENGTNSTLMKYLSPRGRCLDKSRKL